MSSTADADEKDLELLEGMLISGDAPQNAAASTVQVKKEPAPSRDELEHQEYEEFEAAVPTRPDAFV